MLQIYCWACIGIKGPLNVAVIILILLFPFLIRCNLKYKNTILHRFYHIFTMILLLRRTVLRLSQ